MRLIDADAFDERVRVAGGMSEDELTDDFKDGVQAVLYMLSNQPTITPEPHWIPVTERLPDSSRNVLITSRGGVSMARYNGLYFEKGANTHHRKMQTVTAWCELPEPFKGVTE